MEESARVRRNLLTRSLLLALLPPLSVAAQDASQATPDTRELDAVTVTGSRIKRSEVEGPSPVQIISADQIKKEGFVTVYDMLSTLTQATGTVEADSQWGSHTPNASPLNLRNLGPNRSLLLVNGRRVADYPLPYGGQTNFANYGNIPSAAVERIEVLSGGASAIYGSDAIAGVINVILKQGYQGDQVRVRGGTSTEGGRDTWDLSWAGGKTGERWSLTYALQYQKREPLFGRDREQMDDGSDAPRPSWLEEQVAHGGVFRPSVGLGLIDVNTGLRQTPPAGACDQFNGEYSLASRVTYNPDRNTSTDTGQLCGLSADYANYLLQSGSENMSGYLYGTWDFSDTVQGWVSVGVNKSIATWGTDSPSYVADANNLGYYYDAGRDQALMPVRVFTPREVGGYDALRNLNDELSWDVSAGLKGSFADGRFNWEASAGRSRYTVHERVRVIDQARADEYFLGPELGVTADGESIRSLNEQRWWNPVSVEDYNSFARSSINEAYSWSNQAQFTIDGELFQGWAGPISFAGVLEYAHQAYRLNPDPLANVAYLVQNVDRGGGERTRYSGGLEFRIPLLKSLTATLAGRYDRYGDYKTYSDLPLDIGSASDNTWNVGLEWRPLSNLLLRGTYATSFHAPDMHYVLGQPSTSQQTTRDLRRCIETGAYANNTCTAENLDIWYVHDNIRRGTPDLESETGDSWSAGFVWDATDNLSFTADYYVIKVENMIRDLDSTYILESEAGCATGRNVDGTSWLNPGGADFCNTILSRVHRGDDGKIDSIDVGPINLARKQVRGIDLSLRYRLQTDSWGDFQFGVNYTNALSTKEQIFRTDPMPEKRDEDVRTKLRGSVQWQKGNWNASVYGDRVGTVRGVRYDGCRPFADGYVPDMGQNCYDSNPANPTYGQSTEAYFGRIGPFITWNANVGYRITDGMRVNLYVNNLTNATSWNHKDPYKYDYDFGPTRLLSSVGREWSMEYVFDF